MKKFWFSWFSMNFSTLADNDEDEDEDEYEDEDEDEDDEKVISKTASSGRDQM